MQGIPIKATNLFFAATVLACSQVSRQSPPTVSNSHQAPTRETDASDRSFPEWTKIPVQLLAQIPVGAVDSAITARRSSTSELDVIYAFDNPCQASLEAFTQRTNNIVAVRFLIRLAHEGDPRKGDVMLCPQAIVHQAFRVLIPNSPQGALIIRAFVGDGKHWKMIRERPVRAD